MSAAQLEMEPEEQIAGHSLPQVALAGHSLPQVALAAHSLPQVAPAAHSPLKLQAAERLAAHRALRHRPDKQSAELELFEQPAAPAPRSDTRAMRIAAAVAERYAQSQSYRAFLAAEAERAVRQAREAAEAAARNVETVAAAQQQLLSDLENWTPEEADAPSALLPEPPVTRAVPTPAPVLTIRLYEENVRRHAVSGVANAVPHEPLEEEERQVLDEEIAFRQAPVFAEPVETAVPITANLIEFPRQLVAPRKARPRLAEGPLREETAPADTTAQLRIFEVEADQISTVVETESVLPEWSSIRLGACTVTAAETAPVYAVSYPPPLVAAPYGLRIMAALVDGVILTAGFLGFVSLAAYTGGQVPTGQLAALGAGVVLAVLFLFYQLLFFTFAEATPGMRYARIGLCTLGDDNPSRSAMRRRIVAVLLAACPLGIGFLWAWLDEDGLGWHDRISRMYQRSY